MTLALGSFMGEGVMRPLLSFDSLRFSGCTQLWVVQWWLVGRSFRGLWCTSPWPMITDWLMEERRSSSYAVSKMLWRILAGCSLTYERRSPAAGASAGWVGGLLMFLLSYIHLQLVKARAYQIAIKKTKRYSNVMNLLFLVRSPEMSQYVCGLFIL